MSARATALPADLADLVDLASRRLGAGVVAANDEFYAEKENLIRPEPPVFAPATFGHKGQVYDGWETRRRREPGSDWVVVRLAVPGTVEAVVVDTAFFTGNFPAEAEVHGAYVPGWPTPTEVERAAWHELSPRGPLDGDSANLRRVPGAARGRLVSHVRLTIHPDGGVARLRVLGTVVPDPRHLDGRTVDLAAVTAGGHVVDASNRFYSPPDNVISPGHAETMGEGWETRRRRDDGNDWLLLRLATAGALRRIDVDTTHFVGNAPARVRVRGVHAPDGDLPGLDEWAEVLPRTRVQPDTPHWFVLPPEADAGAVTHVRVDVFPDGGLARLRFWGEATPQALDAARATWAELVAGSGRAPALAGLDTAPAGELAERLRACCASGAWVRAMLAARPFADLAALDEVSDQLVAELDWDGVLEALAAHPRIGERPAAAGREGTWSRGEQSGVDTAGDDVRAQLAEGNRAYEQRFGHVYLVNATGRSADELLALLRQRLGNDPANERAVVRRELAGIVSVRLAKLLAEPDEVTG